MSISSDDTEKFMRAHQVPNGVQLEFINAYFGALPLSWASDQYSINYILGAAIGKALAEVLEARGLSTPIHEPQQHGERSDEYGRGAPMVRRRWKPR